MTAADAPGRLESVDPREVKFTQAWCSPWFRNGDGTIPDLFMNIVSGTVRVRDVPPLCVYWYQGRRFSVDNRRLVVWRALRMQGVIRRVPVFQMREDVALPPSFFWKFRTPCMGEFILVEEVYLFVGTHCMCFVPPNSLHATYAAS